MPIEEFFSKFSKLNTDRGRHRWSAATCHCAPHKPFLLLSIMDLIAQGQIVENFIEPSFELVDTWNGYWNAIMPIGKHSSMAYPFPRLQSDGFWYRLAKPGYDANVDYNISSMTKLREIYAGARLDNALFGYLMDPVVREHLRSILIQTYFSSEIQPLLEEQAFVNLTAYTYAKDVMAGVKENTASFAQGPPEIQGCVTRVSARPSSAFTTTAAPCAAFACARPKGTPWWRPPTSCPGARAMTTCPPMACACVGCATGHSMKG